MESTLCTRAFYRVVFHSFIKISAGFLAALLAGFGRAQGVRDRLDGEAAWAGKTAGVKVSLTGTVERMEEKEDQTELWLRDAAAKVGREGMGFWGGEALLQKGSSP